MSAADRDRWNATRFDASAQGGHYESWFQRANHPARPLAFWIRYTIFRPASRPDAGEGELWAILFDGERGIATAVKQDVGLSECSFSPSCLDVKIGDASLDEGGLRGGARSGSHVLEWDLACEGGGPPLLLLPPDLYERPLPRAKALVGRPGAIYRGCIRVDAETVDVDGWQGSQNHNWGSRHTDSYAWGQVSGFDDDPDVFLECSTAQLRFGPLWTPRMSAVVVRAAGEEIRINGVGEALRARGRWQLFDWTIRSRSADATVSIHVSAPREAFVGLTYRNPPGGTKTCLNTKLASCELVLERPGRATRTWKTRHRAAFEILTDRQDHGVPVVV